MSDFADSRKWRLVNDFTIHEDRNLSDRPFMITCVPKVLDVRVTSFEVIRYIEWPTSPGDANRAERYADNSYIKFSGELDDRIIVFSMEAGEIARFDVLTDATIRPLPPGGVGGVRRATVYDGIGYAGMSSQEVPAAGLMEGEPGVLTFLTAYDGPHGPKYPQHVTASLFLDEDKFFKLLAALTLGAKPVTSFKVYILAELFETEVSASLSGPEMPRDYGLLMKGTDTASTGARLESLSISTGISSLQTDMGATNDKRGLLSRVLGVEPEASIASPAVSDRTSSEVAFGLGRLLKAQRYILVALIVLIIVTVLSHQ